MTGRRIAALLGTAAMLLAGCGGLDGEEAGVHPKTVDLPDGRTVLCVYFDGAEKAAMSCDWDTAS